MGPVFSTCPLRSQYPPRSIFGGWTRSVLRGWVCITCDSLSCNGKLPWSLAGETSGRYRLLRPDGNLSKHCERQPGGHRLWRIIFRPELQKHLMWKSVDGSPFDKYMEEIGTNDKKQRGKLFPPQSLMRWDPDMWVLVSWVSNIWPMSVWWTSNWPKCKSGLFVRKPGSSWV